MRRTKIVCTIGPASESPEVIRKMIAAGMDVARFNFSHGTQQVHKIWMDRVTQIASEMGANVALMIDTKGPEIRLGKFEGGRAVLEEGSTFVLTTREVLGNSEIAWVQYPGIVDDVSVGSEVLLGDGNITLVVKSKTPDEIECFVKSGGVISDGKKVNLPGATVSLAPLSEKDMSDIQFGIRQGADFVAASFIRKASDVLEIRRVIEEYGGDLHIIAKIENREGVENLDEILKVADGLMVARGDLGVEIPAEEVPILQKVMIEKAMRLGKPVITATQMLESMVSKPRPTRAEASDVANAILDGTDAVMLSGETAAGRYPVEAVKIMARIAERTEKALNFSRFSAIRVETKAKTTTDAVSHATCTLAEELDAAAIITSTRSGQTTRMVSKYRPKVPIIAATPDIRVMRKLALVWGAKPVLIEPTEDTDTMYKRVVDAAINAGYVREGDMVIITAGVPVGIPGTTNTIKAHTIGNVVLKGTGVGQHPVTGRVRIIRSSIDAANFTPGEILVTMATHAGLMSLIERSAGIIAEEGGLTSHAAVACLNLGIPAIVGAGGATGILKNGTVVTLDPARGLVYLGNARV